jgi:serine/threonine kinase 16
LGGDWRFPDEGVAEAKRGKQRVVSGEAAAEAEQKRREKEGVSEVVKEVVRVCLRVEPSERPDIDQLIEMVEGVVAALPEEGDVPLDDGE